MVNPVESKHGGLWAGFLVLPVFGLILVTSRMNKKSGIVLLLVIFLGVIFLSGCETFEGYCGMIEGGDNFPLR